MLRHSSLPCKAMAALEEWFGLLVTFHYRHLGARVLFIHSEPSLIASDSGRFKPVRSMQF